ESYKIFFDFLRDENENNVRYWEDGGGLKFEILQGSKRLEGYANDAKVRVGAKVAHANDLNVSFMRRLMELNYQLEYGRYSLDEEDNITIVFDTYVLDGSPYKLYYAIKEVATKADKLDDLLLDEFQMLKATDVSLQIPIPEREKEVKYEFTRQSIQQMFGQIENGALDPNQYPGAVAYLYLDCCYRLDYLVKPEGFMMESLERIHRMYFDKNETSVSRKNLSLRKEYEKLLQRPKEAYLKEMYRVNSTFGITVPVNHDRVRSFVDGEWHNMDWYQEHGHMNVAMAIPGYIVGYCLFYYSVPQPDRDFLQLYYRIMYADYFEALGFSPKFYQRATNTFAQKAIKRKIKLVVEKHETQFPRLNPNTRLLNFSSADAFAKSWLLMIRELDMTKSD
ncbi:MAG: hypothetical protein AAFP02_20060, partial [Bacteroidota bacterium]